MMLNVKGEPCWEVKEGLYRGEVVNAGAYETKKGTKHLQIVFSLDYDDGTGREFLVRGLYPQEIRAGSDLYHDIEKLMGPGYLASRKDFMVEHLIRQKAIIHVVHRQGAGHKRPFVTYDEILPPPVVSNCQNQAASDSNRDQLGEDLAAIEKQIEQLSTHPAKHGRREGICRN